MIAFRVDDMSCAHCVQAITQAVQATDAGASVAVDLAAHRVEIQPAAATAEQLIGALQEAGYTPIQIQ
jgi:copper chaperone